MESLEREVSVSTSPEPDNPMSRGLESWEMKPKRSVETLRKEIDRYRAKIDILTKELSATKISWKNHCPSSDPEHRRVIEDLLSYLYLREDVQGLLGLARELGFFDQTHERIKSKQVSPERVDTGTHGPRSASEDGVVMEDRAPAISFYKTGQYWKMGELGNEATLKDLKGYEFIQFLIRHKGQYFDAATVYHLGKTPVVEPHKANIGHVPRGLDVSSMPNSEFFDITEEEDNRAASADSVITGKTVGFIKKEIERLQEELGGPPDPLRRLEIKEKIERLEKYLHDAKYGRSTFDSETSSARINVFKRIKGAIDTLNNEAKENPSLSPLMQALKLKDPGRTIMTGHELCYKPDPSNPVKWRLDPH